MWTLIRPRKGLEVTLKSIAYLDLSLLLFQGVDLLLHGDPISGSGSFLLALQVLGRFLLQATVQLFLELFGFDLVLDLVLAGFLEVLVDIYLVQLVHFSDSFLDFKRRNLPKNGLSSRKT